MPRIASWDILSRPCGTGPWCLILPRTNVLGYSQPSLRDSVRKWSSHAGSKALISCCAYGTAAAVPFLQKPLPRRSGKLVQGAIEPLRSRPVPAFSAGCRAQRRVIPPLTCHRTKGAGAPSLLIRRSRSLAMRFSHCGCTWPVCRVLLCRAAWSTSCDGPPALHPRALRRARSFEHRW